MKKYINKIISLTLSFLVVFSFAELLSQQEAKAVLNENEEFLPESILVGSEPLENNGYITQDNLIDEYSFIYSGPSFKVKGWDAIKGPDGNIVSGCEKSYIKSGEIYQLDFTVTVSNDIYNEATIYPVFRYNNELNHGINRLVGVRYEEANPGAVETSYVLTTNLPACDDSSRSVTDGGFAATLKAGKTYKYTYIFDLKSNNVNYISIYANRLLSGSVKISNATLFAHKGTSADLFNFDKYVIAYLFKDGTNVLTRMYGYSGIDSYGVGRSNTVVAKKGSSLYNVLIESNKKYNITFDMRIPKGSASVTSLEFLPSYDFAETGKLDYTEAYNDMHLLFEEIPNKVSCFVQNTSQITYSAPSNGYSYYYASEKTSTKNRRIYENVSSAEFFNKSGAELYTSKIRLGSAQGREANKNSNVKSVISNNDWVNVKYSLNGQKGQSLREAAWAGYHLNREYMEKMYFYYSSEYAYNNNFSDVNTDSKNMFVPSKDNVTVAFAIDYIYGGVVYDFDNFSPIAEDVKTEETHTYSNSCDTTCNTCGAIRTVDHIYDNDSDKDCNLCGHIKHQKILCVSDFYDKTNWGKYMTSNVSDLNAVSFNGDYATITMDGGSVVYANSPVVELVPGNRYNLSFFIRVNEKTENWNDLIYPTVAIFQVDDELNVGDTVSNDYPKIGTNDYAYSYTGATVNRPEFVGTWQVENCDSYDLSGWSFVDTQGQACFKNIIDGGTFLEYFNKDGWRKVSLTFTAIESSTNVGAQKVSVGFGFSIKSTKYGYNSIDLKDVVLAELDCKHINKTEVKGAVEPTCYEYGYTGDVYCLDCGDKVENGVIMNPTHTYGDDMICDECGYKNFVSGDIDGAGKVGLDDVSVLAKYLAGYDVNVNEAALDVSGDGVVNLFDVVLLAQYVAGWDVKIF